MSRIKIVTYVMLISLVLTTAAGYIFGYHYFSKHFLPGTYLNGKNCSYLTAAEVNKRLNREIETYCLNIESRSGVIYEIKAHEINLTLKFIDNIDSLLFMQNQSKWFLTQKQELFLKTAVSFDKNLLDTSIEQLECMKNMDAPQDAAIIQTENGFETVSEIMGTTLDREKVYSSIETAIREGESYLNLKDCYINPNITLRESDLIHKCEKLNQMLPTIITYNFGDRKETIDRKTINTFLTDYELDRDKILAYVKELSKKYDTVSMERVFVTYDDQIEKINGGDYGWKMDVEKETDALLSLIEKGEIAVRDPIYIQNALERSSNDIGYSYIEIDSSAEKLVLYIDGKPIVEAKTIINDDLNNGCYRFHISDNGSFTFGTEQKLYCIEQVEEHEKKYAAVTKEAFEVIAKHIYTGFPVIIYS